MRQLRRDCVTPIDQCAMSQWIGWIYIYISFCCAVWLWTILFYLLYGLELIYFVHSWIWFFISVDPSVKSFSISLWLAIEQGNKGRSNVKHYVQRYTKKWTRKTEAKRKNRLRNFKYETLCTSFAEIATWEWWIYLNWVLNHVKL